LNKKAVESAMTYAASSCDMSEFVDLQGKVLDKFEEINATSAQIQRAKLDVQQLRLRLLASGIQDASLIPANLRAGPHSPDHQMSELGSLIQWLSDTVDLDAHAMFEVGSDVQVGERITTLGRMVQWRLPSASGQKLSVPAELQQDIASLLRVTRSRGSVDYAQLHDFAKLWEIVGAEVMSQAGVEPAIFLINRETSQAMVVGCWPAMDFSWQTTFDPRAHFGLGSQTLISPTSPLENSSSSGETLMPTDTRSADVIASLATSSDSHLKPQVAGGDRVEVDYQGQWFVGTLQWVEGDMASVQCDVDVAGLFTITPVVLVRLIARPPPQGRFSHVRAKSMPSRIPDALGC